MSIVSIVVLVIIASATVQVRAQQPHQVGLVVQHGDGRVLTRCVEFSEAEISGYEVLVRSGLQVVANFDFGIGGAMCTIDGEGCPVENCWCQCQGSPCIYWNYHHLVDGQWVYSSIGATNQYVQHGDVEGWIWGEGTTQSGPQPPVIPFEQICAPPPTDTPVPPTSTPVPPTATAPPLPEAWFRLDANPVPAGSCTYVRWDAMNAQSATLDGESVALSGSQEVCPREPRTFTLRVSNAHGERSYDLALGVTAAMPTAIPESAATSTPPPATPAPTETSQPTSTPQPTATRQPATQAPPPTATATPQPSATPLTAPTMTPQPPTATLSPTPIPPASPTATLRATSDTAMLPADAPTAAPPPTATNIPPTVVPVSTPPPARSNLVSYLIFGLLAGGLLIGLGLRGLRQH